MNTDQERIKRTIEEGRVKLHVFMPSGRKLWTVVGKDKEYWLDPETIFCSCSAYYFGNLGDDPWTCYHIKSARKAQKENMVQEIAFSDSEFFGFVKGLLSDFWS